VTAGLDRNNQVLARRLLSKSPIPPGAITNSNDAAGDTAARPFRRAMTRIAARAKSVIARWRRESAVESSPDCCVGIPTPY